MPNPRIAGRYAKSLLDLAGEQKKVTEVLGDMESLRATCKESREFTNILRSPIINPDKKNKIVDEIFGDFLTPVSKAFIHLLINKGREEALPEIAEAYIQQYRNQNNIKTVTLTSASEVTDSNKTTITDRLKNQMPDYKIELQTRVDPNLIGGFVVEMEDKLYDASVRRELHDIRAHLIDDSYKVKI